ncbi:hypothetical protein TVAG_318970 [Trichomonas vaginalis G3]|uniref:Uncharacterized protein n=1 Tax=Trichomonas vaginalis (strain ATCC PRA-98 / G3) TaxID=412133 RepID=A2EP75_TRIV3|nr:hypothetical protein TVAGG3_0178350 [Trichomonas vaginalis G3]EAY05542.1 hypothetical protein TVAG_318970 [Trichomonas vaginalis G3]KAI5549101.1 hypothetical protein TVAGG3_0178350 [Trichomonas vaginalis G3]|eukprot:XP_001317765.1 hypothetical protein [Trichomonas vaginalis G3]
MSSKLRLPMEKKYPPKLTQEQLRERTNQELKKYGVENHLQAKINYQTCEAIVQADNKIFDSIKPHPRQCHKTLAWKIALEFIYDFMKQNKLTESYKTAHLEMSQVGDPKSTGFFAQHDREIYFEKLLQTANENGRKTFDDRLNEFRKEQALVPPPELSLDPITSPSTIPTVRGGAPKANVSHGSAVKSRGLEPSSPRSTKESKSVNSSKGFHFSYTNPTGEPNTATKSIQMGEEAAKVYNNQEESQSYTYASNDEKPPSPSPKKPEENSVHDESGNDSYVYTVSDPESPKKSASPKASSPKKEEYSYSYTPEDNNKPETPEKPQTPPKQESPKQEEYSYSYTPEQQPVSPQKQPEAKEQEEYSEYSDEDLESKDNQQPPPKKHEYTFTESVDSKERNQQNNNDQKEEYTYTYSDEEPPKPAPVEQKKPESADYSYSVSIDEKPKEQPQNNADYSYTYSEDEPVVKPGTPQQAQKPKSDTYTYEEFDDGTPKKNDDYSYSDIDTAEKKDDKEQKDEAVYTYEYSDEPPAPAAKPAAQQPANNDYEYTYSDEKIDSTYDE